MIDKFGEHTECVSCDRGGEKKLCVKTEQPIRSDRERAFKETKK